MTKIEQKILYAVAKKQDGMIELTVFENGNCCSIELSAEMANGLANLIIKTNDSNYGD